MRREVPGWGAHPSDAVGRVGRVGEDAIFCASHSGISTPRAARCARLETSGPAGERLRETDDVGSFHLLRCPLRIRHGVLVEGLVRVNLFPVSRENSLVFRVTENQHDGSVWSQANVVRCAAGRGTAGQ